LTVDPSWVVIERQDTNAALRLTGALPWYWYFAGQYSEGRGWIKRALALPGADAPTAARAKVLSGEARMAAYSGARHDALELATESVELFRAVGDRAGLAIALLHLGVSKAMGRDDEGSIAANKEAADLFRKLGDEWGTAWAISGQGVSRSLAPGFEDEARAHEGHAVTMPSDDREVHERMRQQLRATLGDRSYDAEWAQGASLSVQQAVKLAVS
jgi:tetratricopeptide (TPR) repeat protein